MNEARLAIALHIHQPVGNFESVIERASRDCYLPLIELLLEYPDIKIALHVSGCLLDYFETRHAPLLDKIDQMSRRGQIEILSGGYYEPILIAIPRRDLSGQIEMMSAYIKSKFGHQPKGMWIPERVWAPWLTEPLQLAGIEYCILDDTHLLKAGLAKEDMYGYFLTKDKDGKIAVFPSDKKLRYTIPFGQPSQIIGYFAEVAKRKKEPLFVYGDDGEKFGEWPGTHKWVFEERWLKNFFDELRRNNSWLKLVHFSDYMDSHPPLGRVEIPEASYDEMMEWNQGSWLNFLAKYPESNQMHKKMFYVSDKLHDAIRSHRKNNELEEARRNLYKGQCNCAYWHGVFGGLYLYHLRSSIYNHLIKADKMIDEVVHKDEKQWIKIKKIDLDSNGKNEFVMESASFGLYLDPEEGGVLKELDYRPFSTNLVNTLSRRRESYHKKILKMIKDQAGDERTVKTIHEDIKIIDPAIGKRLAYDRYPRYCLRTYFIDERLKPHSFINGSFKEWGHFAEGFYKAKKNADTVILEREESIAKRWVKLSKEIQIKKEAELEVIYRIEKKDLGQLDTLLAVEFNITMPFLNSERYNYYADKNILGKLDEEGTIGKASSFGIIDSQKTLSLGFNFSNKTKEIWYFPVKTVSQSERAYSLNFQCSSILFIWRLDFKKRKSCSFKINMLFHSPHKNT